MWKKRAIFERYQKNIYCPRGRQTQFHIAITQPLTSTRQDTRSLSGPRLLLRVHSTKVLFFGTRIWPFLTIHGFQDNSWRNQDHWGFVVWYVQCLSVALATNLGPQASPRCGNTKVRKWLKSGHFYLFQILFSCLERGKGVERCWFVNLVHTLCTQHWLIGSPFGLHSLKWQSVDLKKSRKSIWKKSIFWSYKTISISTTRKELGPNLSHQHLMRLHWY